MTPADKNHLQIRCPSCSQKFKVGADLMGRVVECGACEKRFDVSDDVIVKGQKFYPGERDPDALTQFGRVPGAKIGVSAATPAVPGPHQEKGYFSPITRVSKLRILCGWIGVLLVLVLVWLLQINSPGPLGKLPLGSRIIIAVVGGCVGLGLVAYANPRTRKRTLTLATAFVTVLLAVPFIFQSKLTPTSSEPPRETTVVKPVETPVDAAPTIDEIRQKAGTERLEAEIQRLAESGTGGRAVGIWLRDMNDSNRLAVRDFVLRASGASPSSIIYPRDGRDYLMVLTGLTKSIDEIAEITARFGRAPQIHTELSLIEVKVESSVFIEGPLDKLTDKGSPAFYDLNKRELESIQLDRISRAVKRLADSEPKIYREDITRQLIGLVAVDQVDFTGDICRALMVWATDPAIAAPAVLSRLNRLHAAQSKIPREMIALLAMAKEAGALPIVEKLWISDATAWEPLLGEFGPLAEPVVLARFPSLDGVMRHSAARLLRIVGGSASLPVLEGAKVKADPEMLVLIDSAITAIKARN